MEKKLELIDWLIFFLRNKILQDEQGDGSHILLEYCWNEWMIVLWTHQNVIQQMERELQIDLEKNFT